jgi:TatD DNase family protein
MRLFDTHCHLTDGRFDDDRAAVLTRAREAGVDRLVTISSTADDAEKALALADSHDWIWSTAGVHPHDAETGTPENHARVRNLLEADRVVAVGETGLDYFYDNAPRQAQRSNFLAHIEMASASGLPVIVHTREAEDDTSAILRDAPTDVVFVLHCFTGSMSLLETGLELGCYVSFSGIATFSKFDAGERVRAVPDDRIMAETDSPYLAPVPHRGKRNEPAYVGEVVRQLALLRGVPPEDMADLIFRNGSRFYGLTE